MTSVGAGPRGQRGELAEQVGAVGRGLRRRRDGRVENLGRNLAPPRPLAFVQERPQQHPAGVPVDSVVPLDPAPDAVQLRERQLREILGLVPVPAQQVGGRAQVVGPRPVVGDEVVVVPHRSPSRHDVGPIDTMWRAAPVGSDPGEVT
jgi:hypothetical protein